MQTGFVLKCDCMSASHCEGNEGSIREIFQAVFIIECISQFYISISNATSSQVFHGHCFEEYIKMLSPLFLSMGREEQRILPIVPKVIYRLVSYLLQRYGEFLTLSCSCIHGKVELRVGS